MDGFFTPLGLAEFFSTTYADIIPNSTTEANYWQTSAQIIGDYFIRCGADSLFRSYLPFRLLEKTWRYVFTLHPAPLRSPTYFLNATHGTELPYVFMDPSGFARSFTKGEWTFSEQLSNFWSAFVTSEQPAPVPTWSVFDPNNPDSTTPVAMKRNCDRLKLRDDSRSHHGFCCVVLVMQKHLFCSVDGGCEVEFTASGSGR